MTLGVRPPNLLHRIDAVIAPGVALGFSVIVAMLAPHYVQWYGNEMPPLTSWFVARYGTWLAITAAGVVMQILGRFIDKTGPVRTLWTAIDLVIAGASVAIIVIGMIALVLPLFTLQLPI